MSLVVKYELYGDPRERELLFPMERAHATLEIYRDITHFSRTWSWGTDMWKAAQIFQMLDVFVWTRRLIDGDHAIARKVLEFLWR
jgi:hypothetical protein